MCKGFDVAALGELLIDFTDNGLSEQGNTVFEANPGGAPCNVLAMLKKLGRSCAFIGKVGEDMFGHLLRDVAAEAGAEGSCSYYEDKRVFVPSCKLGGTIEPTGAGDTFCACVLNYVLEHGLGRLTTDDLTQMLRFANTAAYLVTTRKGAIRSMPEQIEVTALL